MGRLVSYGAVLMRHRATIEGYNIRYSFAYIKSTYIVIYNSGRLLCMWRLVQQLILDDISKRGKGAQLDSDANYAQRAECSVPTVKRAMADLERLGFVIRRRGRKTKSSERPAVVSGTEFSFSHSAKESGCELVTRLIEKSCRLPSRTSIGDVEMRAHRALGLKRDESFFVISRRRDLNDTPRVIHRSYLNPSHYPPTFLADHDFENESLLEILEKYGLRINGRETRVRAGLPTETECELLSIENEPVLNVEQSLYATSPNGRLVTAEYLHATYSRWEYVISDRR
jgi:DNA-binding GntR family transcriptional regulator